MPTYRFRRKNGKEFEIVMMISELDDYRAKHPNLELCIPSTLNIISSTGTLDGKTSSGWKDVLGKISEAHPRSELAKQYGKKSNKEVKIQSTIEKHKKIRQQRTQGR